MSSFVKGTRFSNEDLEYARNLSTVDVISNRTGFTFKKCGYEYHAKEHDSLVVFSDGKGWSWYSQNKKGNNSIAFLMNVEGLNFQDAVCELISPQNDKANLSYFKPQDKNDKPRILELPPKSNTTNNIENYLCNERKISLVIIKHCVNYGYLYEDKKRNCVFVGRDSEGTPKYASKRGTYNPPGQESYKRDCSGSNKMFGYLIEGSCKEHVFVFEAPIDVLSHATLSMDKAKGIGRSDWSTCWQRHTRLALGGVSDNALRYYLSQNKNIKTISFCLDTDETGIRHANEYKEKYEKEGYKVNVFSVPKGMGTDYNEYLQKYSEQKLHEKSIKKHTNRKR